MAKRISRTNRARIRCEFAARQTTQMALARKYNCGGSTVGDILNNGHGDNLALDERLVRGEKSQQITADLEKEAKNRKPGAKRSKASRRCKGPIKKKQDVCTSTMKMAFLSPTRRNRSDRIQVTHHHHEPAFRRVTIQFPVSSHLKDVVKQESVSPPSISQHRRRASERYGIYSGGTSISADNRLGVQREATSSSTLPASSQSSIARTESTPPATLSFSISERACSSALPSTAPFFHHPELKHLSQAFYAEGFHSEEDVVQLMLHSSEEERISVLDGLRASWGINMRDWVRAKRALTNKLWQIPSRGLPLPS